MDIKDWILIGGGILLLAVVGHGFLLAWRSRRDTLRMDIDPNVPREDIDPLDLLRAELPNGGARVRNLEPMMSEPEQNEFALETAVTARAQEPRKPERAKRPIVAQRRTVPQRTNPTAAKARPIVPERTGSLRDRLKATAAAPQIAREEPDESEDEFDLPAQSDVGKAPNPEVIVINVLARNGAQFAGDDLLEAFLRNGLKFGEMNIFHRVQPMSKEVQFSVASAVEPGTFDLSNMEAFRTPGVSFFMQMPGPERPLEVFEDMLAVTRDVAASLGADLKDEHQSVMTSQTIQHCRSRIEDFSRKRMSQRA